MTTRRAEYTAGYESARDSNSWGDDLRAAYRAAKPSHSLDWLAGFRLFMWVHRAGMD